MPPERPTMPETSGSLPDADGYDYVIRAIQHLDMAHGIHFFIGSRDFDVLYRWWEKRIPLSIIRSAIDRVVERRRRRGKPIATFGHFSYEVRKSYQAFLNLRIGEAALLPLRPPADARSEFLAHLPEALEGLREEFARLQRERLSGKAADPESMFAALLRQFQGDEELRRKSEFFLNQLAPEWRKPEMERRFRMNFLIHRFHIPIEDIL